MNLRIAACILSVLTVAGPACAQEVKTVTIDMSNYAYAPSELHLRHGTTYVLHFANSAGKSHDFSAPDFFRAAAIAPEDRAKVVDGGVDLEGGQAIDVKLVPGVAGTYQVRCTHFMHAMLGMTGKVVVD